ncbi:MAG: hypothetical protein HXX13_15675 [Bacteroidetes bacterium]|nr:hypothetical protein [Bacteroidota bacterium]
MKTKLTLAVSVFLLLIGSLAAQKMGKITVSTSFKGIIEGYDHINKTQLYIDGALAGESPESPESKPITFSADVPRGKHQVYVINLASYEGKWEEHTKDNNYSIDASYRGEIKLKKKVDINLVFDIDKEEAQVKIKK